MKTTTLISRIILVGVATLLLQACASTPSGPAAVAGTWTNSMGTVWAIRSDGSFDVDFNKDGKRDVWGNCTFSGDTITIIGTGGSKMPKGCLNTHGVYHYKRTGDTLHFTLVSDPCHDRKRHLAEVWTKK